ncbi:uncharacterized protein BKA55DRAFT_710154 [Fusarium redolens]|uniref:Uncharacterized protein n=1 Tax=Fusarium redolens TaxID=48865 RepID=A0A9P9G860_FUSRE|nr:uncharacterized protein BKA55DRAFT_710154 [Fusarium redolens]KAH7233978.1 hypothetical protein BKA55DRAFT_710154 [Fusarium redolens]
MAITRRSGKHTHNGPSANSFSSISTELRQQQQCYPEGRRRSKRIVALTSARARPTRSSGKLPAIPTNSAVDLSQARSHRHRNSDLSQHRERPCKSICNNRAKRHIGNLKRFNMACERSANKTLAIWESWDATDGESPLKMKRNAALVTTDIQTSHDFIEHFEDVGGDNKPKLYKHKTIQRLNESVLRRSLGLPIGKLARFGRATGRIIGIGSLFIEGGCRRWKDSNNQEHARLDALEPDGDVEVEQRFLTVEASRDGDVSDLRIRSDQKTRLIDPLESKMPLNVTFSYSGLVSPFSRPKNLNVLCEIGRFHKQHNAIMEFRFVNEHDPVALRRRRLQAQRTQRYRQRQKEKECIEPSIYQVESSQTVDSAADNSMELTQNSELAFA